MFDLSQDLAHCTKCGMCLSVCPTYQATLEEPYSPRGRLALIEQYSRGMEYETMSEFLESCFRCGLCQDICPTNTQYASLIRYVTNNSNSGNLQEYKNSLRNQLDKEYMDGSRKKTFLAMLQHLEKKDNENEPGRDPLPTTGKPIALLLFNPVLEEHSPGVINRCEQILNHRGFQVTHDNAVNSIFLPWSENGMQDVLLGIIHNLILIPIKEEVAKIFTLDPGLFATIKHNLYFHPEIMHQVPPLELFPYKLFKSERHDINLTNVKLDKTLSSYNKALLEIEIDVLQECELVPDNLSSAGASPVFNENATAKLEAIIEKKRVWLKQNKINQLITLNPITLLRFSQAIHLVDIL